jgi:hypothetical protein
VQEKLRSGEITVCGDQWPLLVYEDQNYDPEEPWDGLFRSRLLVWVRRPYLFVIMYLISGTGVQTHLHLAQLR